MTDRTFSKVLNKSIEYFQILSGVKHLRCSTNNRCSFIFELKNKEKQEQIKRKRHTYREVHKSPHMKRPRSNRTENNKEDTADECGVMLLRK